MHIVTTQGVCAKQIMFQVEEEKVKNVKFVSGCPGNAIGLSNMVEGQGVSEVVERLRGVTCGNKSTSCPAQLAEALEKFL